MLQPAVAAPKMNASGLPSGSTPESLPSCCPACGHVVHVSHLVGSESLPQVALAFAEGLRLVPSKTSLCYDFACGLARFVRNPVRAESTDVLRRLAACTIVVPDSRIRNHTACVDPSNATFYMPEVKKAAHPELAGVNCVLTGAPPLQTVMHLVPIRPY